VKSKPKPLRKVKRGLLVRKAHALIREIVMLRDKGCVCPPPKKGHSSIRQAGHIIPSTKGGSRFSLWNVFEQCSSCNSRHTRDWQIYEGWFIDKFGHDRWDEVREESRNEGLKSTELQELLLQLEEILEVMDKFPEYKPYFSQNEILSGKWAVGWEALQAKLRKRK
jgi:hypothetical protein